MRKPKSKQEPNPDNNKEENNNHSNNRDSSENELTKSSDLESLDWSGFDEKLDADTVIDNEFGYESFEERTNENLDENIFDNPDDEKFTSSSKEQSDISDLDIDYEYFPDRSYFFIYGPSGAGKTVIIGSIYEYLSTYRSADFGDTLTNLNRGEIPYEKTGNQLLNQFIERSEEQEFPNRTATALSEKGNIPKHLNFKFEPADEEKPVFPFCFMDMAGEDLENIDFDSNRPLPKSIRTYVEDVPKENLCFIYVLDPMEDRKNKTQQTQLFNAFINLIDKNNHRETPVLLLVSKWDAVKDYEDVELYLKEKHRKIWGVIQQAKRNFTFAEFSIGDVDENKKIKKFDPSYPERVFKWMYQNQMGISLSEPVKTSNVFWGWIKKYL